MDQLPRVAGVDPASRWRRGQIAGITGVARDYEDYPSTGKKPAAGKRL